MNKILKNQLLLRRQILESIYHLNNEQAHKKAINHRYLQETNKHQKIFEVRVMQPMITEPAPDIVEIAVSGIPDNVATAAANSLGEGVLEWVQDPDVRLKDIISDLNTQILPVKGTKLDLELGDLQPMRFRGHAVSMQPSEEFKTVFVQIKTVPGKSKEFIATAKKNKKKLIQYINYEFTALELYFIDYM